MNPILSRRQLLTGIGAAFLTLLGLPLAGKRSATGQGIAAPEGGRSPSPGVPTCPDPLPAISTYTFYSTGQWWTPAEEPFSLRTTYIYNADTGKLSDMVKS